MTIDVTKPYLSECPSNPDDIILRCYQFYQKLHRYPGAGSCPHARCRARTSAMPSLTVHLEPHGYRSSRHDRFSNGSKRQAKTKRCRKLPWKRRTTEPGLYAFLLILADLKRWSQTPSVWDRARSTRPSCSPTRVAIIPGAEPAEFASRRADPSLSETSPECETAIDTTAPAPRRAS